jgi:hypothetical protein
VFSRGDDGSWTLREAGAGPSVPVAALAATLETDRVYAAIELAASLRALGTE